MIVRCELVWTFTPPDFIASPYARGEFRFDSGKVVAEIKPPLETVPDELIARLGKEVEAELVARSVATHREVVLSRNPRVNQFDEHGNCMARILVEDVLRVTVSAPEADVQIVSSDGTLIRDTKAERASIQEDLIARLAPKIAASSLIRDLASMYRRAISDPANEFVHLYEIRDRLSAEFGSDENARNALGISVAEWSRIGKLANAHPLTVGRHRGQFDSLRDPTAQELAEARDAARILLLAAAEKVR